MKFYSEITKKLYETKEELVKAEVEATKAKTNRAEKAKEVTELIKKATEAWKAANKAINDFVKEYGSFKTTIKDEDITPTLEGSFWDIFDKFIF